MLIENFFFLIFNFISYAGKKKEDIETFVNEGVYEIEKLKEDGWITDIKYDDEVTFVPKFVRTLLPM